MLDVDALAQEIRRVDGSNSLGAGALAEALMPFISKHLADMARTLEASPVGREQGREEGFPPEAYAYEADVTPEGVAEMRRRAKQAIDAQEWEPLEIAGPKA
mgnify:CR=1 FL=1